MRRAQTESGDAAPRVKRARAKPGGESSSAAADEDAATAAWSRSTYKSREVLVREYIMLLLLERRNLRFKEYLTQCTLEEKIADVAFDASDGEDGRRAKLRVLHEYNDVLGLGVHEEPSFEAQSVAYTLGEQRPTRLYDAVAHSLAAAISEISDDAVLRDAFAIGSGSADGTLALDSLLSELEPEIRD